MKKEDRATLAKLVSQYGSTALISEIDFEKNNAQLTLTIVANLGLHPLPSELLKGEIYIASEGNLDFENGSAVTRSISQVLKRLKRKLVEKRWSQIYLLPFGHSVLSMNIKMAVYRTLRIETIDYFYHGEGRYSEIAIDSRTAMLDVKAETLRR